MPCVLRCVLVYLVVLHSRVTLAFRNSDKGDACGKELIVHEAFAGKEETMNDDDISVDIGKELIVHEAFAGKEGTMNDDDISVDIGKELIVHEAFAGKEGTMNDDDFPVDMQPPSGTGGGRGGYSVSDDDGGIRSRMRTVRGSGEVPSSRTASGLMDLQPPGDSPGSWQPDSRHFRHNGSMMNYHHGDPRVHSNRLNNPMNGNSRDAQPGIIGSGHAGSFGGGRNSSGWPHDPMDDDDDDTDPGVEWREMPPPPSGTGGGRGGRNPSSWPNDPPVDSHGSWQPDSRHFRHNGGMMNDHHGDPRVHSNRLNNPMKDNSRDAQSGITGSGHAGSREDSINDGGGGGRDRGSWRNTSDPFDDRRGSSRAIGMPGSWQDTRSVPVGSGDSGYNDGFDVDEGVGDDDGDDTFGDSPDRGGEVEHITRWRNEQPSRSGRVPSNGHADTTSSRHGGGSRGECYAEGLSYPCCPDKLVKSGCSSISVPDECTQSYEMSPVGGGKPCISLEQTGLSTLTSYIWSPVICGADPDPHTVCGPDKYPDTWMRRSSPTKPD